MTVEERISKLENHVRKFNVIVAGGGNVLGGFGALPVADTLQERVVNLEKSVRNFRLEGDGVLVAGNFDQGYIIG